MRSNALFFVCTIAMGACILDWEKLHPVTDDAEAPDALVDAGMDAIEEIPLPSDGCVPQLVINEVRADGLGGPSDELIEIKNVGTCTVQLTGWTLQYSSASGSTPFPIWTGTVTDSVPAKGYVTIGGQAFAGTVIGRITNPNGSLSKTGGGIGLFAPSASLAADSVAYQALTTTTHPFVRPDGGTGAPNPPSGQSIARTPDGTNTNDNAKDFAVAASTPNGAN